MSDSQLRPQDFVTHRNIPRLFLAVGLVLVVEQLRRIWVVIAEPTWSAAWQVVFGLSLLAMWWMLRTWALRLQDRLIRAEVRGRLDLLLGAKRRSDIARLRLSHLIAMRFAGDQELPGLFEAVISGELDTQDEIKQRITDWQADWLRV
jgi:hypothetical protein